MIYVGLTLKLANIQNLSKQFPKQQLKFFLNFNKFLFQVDLFEKYKNVDKYFKAFMNLPKVKEFFSKDENSKIPFLPPAYLKIKL